MKVFLCSWLSYFVKKPFPMSFFIRNLSQCFVILELSLKSFPFSRCYSQELHVQDEALSRKFLLWLTSALSSWLLPTESWLFFPLVTLAVCGFSVSGFTLALWPANSSALSVWKHLLEMTALHSRSGTARIFLCHTNFSLSVYYIKYVYPTSYLKIIQFFICSS